MDRNLKLLKELQDESLEYKVAHSLNVISAALSHFEDQMYISFSGGKDSLVLLDLVRRINPDIPAVFVDTGLEFPEIREFIKTIDNVTWLKPKKNFKQVIEKYGYPVISKEQSQFIYEYRTTHSDKLRELRLSGVNNSSLGRISKKWQYLIQAPFPISHKCCQYLKKDPAKKYEKETGLKPFIGTMASESFLRRSTWMRQGCNSFEGKRAVSNPLAIWKEEDIWEYIDKFSIQYSTIYDKGYDRTGCIFCMFGIHLETEVNKFQKMKITHPALYNYCINKLGCGAVLDYINVDYR